MPCYRNMSLELSYPGRQPVDLIAVSKPSICRFESCISDAGWQCGISCYDSCRLRWQFLDGADGDVCRARGCLSVVCVEFAHERHIINLQPRCCCYRQTAQPLPAFESILSNHRHICRALDILSSNLIGSVCSHSSFLFSIYLCCHCRFQHK